MGSGRPEFSWVLNVCRHLLRYLLLLRQEESDQEAGALASRGRGIEVFFNVFEQCGDRGCLIEEAFVNISSVLYWRFGSRETGLSKEKQLFHRMTVYMYSNSSGVALSRLFEAALLHSTAKALT